MRRLASTAARLPLVLLVAVALAGCGSGEDLDGADPALSADTASPTSADPRLLAAQSTSAGGFVGGATERPAPSWAPVAVSGKPL